MKAADMEGFLVLPWPGGGSGSSDPGMGEEGWEHLMLSFGSLLGVVLICLVLLRKWIAGGVCHCSVQLDGKTVLITGANGGIGKETSRDLARRGARVVMACRDLTRAEQAAEEIRRSTGNSNVVIRHLDLASTHSIRQFAKDFLDSEERLDILINNAGVMMCPKWLTEDGFETQMAVNHLGHFLLTNLLLPKLKSSAPSRVVNVSSIAHNGGHIDFDDLFFSQRPYSSLESYKQSKLANILFSRELARQLSGPTKWQKRSEVPANIKNAQRSLQYGFGVSSFSLHPGIIRTELGRHVEDWSPLLGFLLKLPCLVFMKTPWEGCQTTLYCALTPGLEELSGQYFSDCAEKEPAPEGQDDVVAGKLWEVSARLVGLKDTS